MKINIANPRTGLQKQFDIDDAKLLLPFLEKRIGDEVPGDSLGAEFANSIVQITGGSDMEGFPMMQGVLTKSRVRLLFRDMMKKGTPQNSPTSATASQSTRAPANQLSNATKKKQLMGKYNSATLHRVKHFNPRKSGQMKRKTIRGCIVGSDLAVLNLILKKSGDIPNLTDYSLPRRLGPKRASKIRKLFNLSPADDVKKFVISRSFNVRGRMRKKSPKIQRLITATRLQRKRREAAIVKNRMVNSAKEKADYFAMIKQWKGKKANTG